MLVFVCKGCVRVNPIFFIMVTRLVSFFFRFSPSILPSFLPSLSSALHQFSSSTTFNSSCPQHFIPLSQSFFVFFLPTIAYTFSLPLFPIKTASFFLIYLLPFIFTIFLAMLSYSSSLTTSFHRYLLLLPLFAYLTLFSSPWPRLLPSPYFITLTVSEKLHSGQPIA